MRRDTYLVAAPWRRAGSVVDSAAVSRRSFVFHAPPGASLESDC